MRARTIALALLGLGALAFALRAAGFENVFLPSGEIVFAYADPYYQLRRGLVSFLAFPAVLQRDAYVNFPDGVGAVLPPFFHLLLGGLGHLFGRDVRAFELGAAWLGPVVGALTLLPAYAAARALGGPRTALAAAALVAVLPVSVLAGRAGNADYHAFLTLVGAGWLAALLSAVRPDATRRGLVVAYAGLTLARTIVLTAWPGSLAYLGPADGLLFAAEVARGSPARLLAHAASLAASAAVVAPVLHASGPPVAGDFTTLSLSWLHMAALLTLMGVTLALAALEAVRPARTLVARAARALALVALGAVLVLFPGGARDGLLAAAGFLGADDPWVHDNAEARPLFRFDAQGALVAPVLYGLLGYGIPLLWLAALARARDPRLRPAALVLAAWSAIFGALAALQMRYGAEYLVAFSLCAALALASLARAVARRTGPRVGRAVAATVLALSLVPGLLVLHAPAIQASLAALATPPTGDRALTLPVGTLVRFSEEIRRVTPETSGYLDEDARPEYGVLVEPLIGHTVLYAARRPSPAGNFGRFVGPEGYDATERFYATPDEDEAVRISDSLRSPYVVTTELGLPPEGAKRILHDADGRAPDGSRWTRFRLVTEGPAGGRGLGELFGAPGRPGMAPYKLFERVAGAVLEVPAPEGTPVAAQVVVRTPIGRRFVYRVSGVAGADGIARLRVPYATDTSTPARPQDDWRIEIAGRAAGSARTSDDDVRTGRSVRALATEPDTSGDPERRTPRLSGRGVL